MLRAARPLWICLIVTPILSCAGLKKFPEDHLWEFDPKNMACGEYKITDYEHFKYVWVQDVPIGGCPAIFGFTSSAIPKVLDWAQDAIDYSKEHCK